MFWSKIWFFLVAIAAVLGIGVALTVPRPAERKVLEAEDVRLARSMDAARLWLILEARHRADTALRYARVEIYKELKKIKEDAASAEAIAQQLHDSARASLANMLEGTRSKKPQLLIALDAWGRVVARAGPDEAEERQWGDDLSGYFLVRDALRGYMRDDLWVTGGKLYRVAAAPVVARPEQGPDSYVGVLVVGHEVDEALARQVASVASTRSCGAEAEDAADVCDTHVAFFVRGETIANSGPVTLGSDIKAELAKRSATMNDSGYESFSVEGEATSYRVFARRLPGEAGAQDGFYVVYSERPRAMGFAATMRDIVKDDISFGNFPWVLLGLGFASVVVVGLLLMWAESDRPLKRLVRDALAIGKGDKRTFSEDDHHGKHGSIARSVNLALDKLTREKGAPRRDLGALYASSDEHDSVRPLPPVNPHGAPVTAFSPPPPSELAFDSEPAASSYEYAIPPPPPPMPVKTVLPRAASAGGPSLPDMPMPAPEPRSPPRPARMPPPITAGRATPGSGRVPAPLPPPPEPRPLSAVHDDILGGHDPDEAQLVTLGNPAHDVGGMTPPPRATSSTSTLNVTAMPESVLAESSSIVRQQSTPEGEELYFRQVYEDFIELKRKCGENTDSLTFEKFAAKLGQNRDQLIAKYACKAVRFQVYVKDGKAALKATPVKG